MNSLDPIPRMTQTRLAFLERILTRFGLAALILGSLLPALRGQTAPAQARAWRPTDPTPVQRLEVTT